MKSEKNDIFYDFQHSKKTEKRKMKKKIEKYGGMSNKCLTFAF